MQLFEVSTRLLKFKDVVEAQPLKALYYIMSSKAGEHLEELFQTHPKLRRESQIHQLYFGIYFRIEGCFLSFDLVGGSLGEPLTNLRGG